MPEPDLKESPRSLRNSQSHKQTGFRLWKMALLFALPMTGLFLLTARRATGETNSSDLISPGASSPMFFSEFPKFPELPNLLPVADAQLLHPLDRLLRSILSDEVEYPRVRNLLNLCAYLQPDALPESLLKRWLARQMLSEEAKNIEAISHVLIDKLISHDLLERRTSDQTLSIMPSVQENVRKEYGSDDERFHSWETLLTLFTEALEEIHVNPLDDRGILYRTQLIEHFAQLMKHIKKSEGAWERLPKTQLAKLLCYSANAYDAAQQPYKASIYWHEALTLLSDGNPIDKFRRRNDKPGVLKDLEASLSRLRQMPEISRQAFVDDMARLEIKTLHALALLSRQTGKIESSQKYFQQTLAIIEPHAEKGHLSSAEGIPDKVILLFEMGRNSYTLGKISIAQKSFKQGKVRLRQALQYLENALKESRTLPNPSIKTTTVLNVLVGILEKHTLPKYVKEYCERLLLQTASVPAGEGASYLATSEGLIVPRDRDVNILEVNAILNELYSVTRRMYSTEREHKYFVEAKWYAEKINIINEGLEQARAEILIPPDILAALKIFGALSFVAVLNCVKELIDNSERVDRCRQLFFYRREALPEIEEENADAPGARNAPQ